MKLIAMTPGMIASAVSASRQFSAISTPIAMISRMTEIGRRHNRHLQQPRGRVHVAGQARQDAAGLHVPQFGQRQVQQPFEQ